jgi:predicted peptidase
VIARDRHQVRTPPNFTKSQRWPVILFLHGIGERGDDNVAQLRHGLPPILERDPDRYPFVVVMPQCDAERSWFSSAMETRALNALDATIDEFNGDRDRVVLTGISMGGMGAWWLARHRGRFAAVVPICGPIPRGAYDELAKSIGPTPVWAFHGDADNVIDVEESRRMVNALRAIGGEVRYTEYAGVGHNSWDRAYAEPELPAWMIARTA